MQPRSERAREALRRGRSPSLSRRRRIAALAALGLADFAIISLYQLGVIRRLPDPPGHIFDSNAVNAAKSAYPFGVPDGPLGAALYAGTLVLAGAGGERRAGRSPLLDVALAGAALAGAASGVAYMYDMLFKQKKVCPYCVAGAALNLAMVPLAWPDARAAVEELRS